ncbi:phage integrase N-terminal domain-containing protein [Methyloraptor flagellatus]|uniref:Phage integrase N-terminal domain-containing protein n=1 Tax=Methyloraptor flagellatus TaxID=3162530 RepID=A0AAU7XH12_9HYPH
MDALQMSLRTLCAHNADGSRMTQAQRFAGLLALADDLRSLGYRLPDAQSLKPKHVGVLVESWKQQGLSDGTIKNRMSWVRWVAMKTRKPGLIPQDNAELGLADKPVFKGARADTTTRARMTALPERMQLALRLQMAFGLRLEESLKFRVADADKGTAVTLTGSWCKGGRARTIPVTHDRQRDLLDELHTFCGGGSLVPAAMSYRAFRRAVERATLKAGITNVHKHRHWYACWRFRTLSGIKPPVEGGPSHDRLPPAEQARLDAIRMEISRELGHGRIQVTDAYLGRRWPPREAAQ